MDELPEDIREEILGQLKESANKVVEVPDAQAKQPVPVIAPVDDDIVEVPAPSSLASETPRAQQKAAGAVSASNTPTKSVGHITRQLHPKTKTILAPNTSILFTKQKEANQTSREELQELGIDPDWYFDLPKDLQREQLLHGRESARKKKFGSKGLMNLAERAGSPSMAKAGGFGFGLDRGRLARSPSIDAPRNEGVKLEVKFPEMVALNLASRAEQADQGAKSHTKNPNKPNPPTDLVNMGDIQAHIKRWVVTCHKGQLAPSPADIDALRKWLIKCLKMEGTGTGIEKATIIMKWWRELLRAHWGEVRDMKSMKFDEEKSGGIEQVNEAWWRTFWETKAEMDIVVRDMIGGKLSLK